MAINPFPSGTYNLQNNPRRNVAKENESNPVLLDQKVKEKCEPADIRLPVHKDFLESESPGFTSSRPCSCNFHTPTGSSDGLEPRRQPPAPNGTAIYARTSFPYCKPSQNTTAPAYSVSASTSGRSTLCSFCMAEGHACDICARGEGHEAKRRDVVKDAA